LREASLRVRAHDGVGTGDNDGRFLRQVIEKESEKQEKTPNPHERYDHPQVGMTITVISQILILPFVLINFENDKIN
jgi:hypothetical protein